MGMASDDVDVALSFQQLLASDIKVRVSLPDRHAFIMSVAEMSAIRNAQIIPRVPELNEDAQKLIYTMSWVAMHMIDVIYAVINLNIGPSLKMSNGKLMPISWAAFVTEDDAKWREIVKELTQLGLTNTDYLGLRSAVFHDPKTRTLLPQSDAAYASMRNRWAESRTEEEIQQLEKLSEEIAKLADSAFSGILSALEEFYHLVSSSDLQFMPTYDVFYYSRPHYPDTRYTMRMMIKNLPINALNAGSCLFLSDLFETTKRAMRVPNPLLRPADPLPIDLFLLGIDQAMSQATCVETFVKHMIVTNMNNRYNEYCDGYVGRNADKNVSQELFRYTFCLIHLIDAVWVMSSKELDTIEDWIHLKKNRDVSPQLKDVLLIGETREAHESLASIATELSSLNVSELNYRHMRTVALYDITEIRNPYVVRARSLAFIQWNFEEPIKSNILTLLGMAEKFRKSALMWKSVRKRRLAE
ncbi:unnamed protein product [Caenorhabditis sp. 36 PRJEB53466]|nr:unnamed protein product [Caenorhabditis sp. 36 PRJEB53466]